MPKAHLLPCPFCNAELRVEMRQAGQTMRCRECQGEFEVPTIGRLRALPAVDEETTPAATTVPHPLKPWFFVGGLIVAAVFGMTGWLLYQYSASMIAMGEMYLESVPPEYFDTLKTKEDLWRSWYQFFEEQGELPPWQPSTIKITLQTGNLFRKISLGLLSGAGLGLLAALGSFFLPNQKAGAKRSGGRRRPSEKPSTRA